MTVWLAAALASPGTERDAWPSLPLEQPVVTSRGWTVLAVDAADAGGWGLDGAVRWGFARGWDVGLAGRLDPDARGAPVLSTRWRVALQEAPVASAAVVASASPPWQGEPGAAAVGAVGAVATAPFRWEARAGLGARTSGDLVPEGAVGSLLQLGPLAARGELEVAPRPTARFGGQLNLSRGLAVAGALHRPLHPTGDRGGAIGVRIAW